MSNYHVKVAARDDRNEEFELGETVISAGTKQEAGAAAIRDLWDPRLDAAGCIPRVVVTRSAFDPVQRFVLDRYNDGIGPYITRKGELKAKGDGLLAFLVTELSEAEDCNGLEDALDRLAIVEVQISRLRAAFAGDFRGRERQ